MQLSGLLTFFAAAAATVLAQDQYKGQFQNPGQLPAKVDPAGGQFGWNDCVQRFGDSTKKGHCQNIFINSVKDFCLYGPHKAFPGKKGEIGSLEPKVISYCLKSGYGTRLIPEGTIHGAHFLKTPHFVQVTGHGDLTKINIQPGDEGGELDPHGATGSGNPVGGLVFTRARTGQWERLPEWQHFISHNEYCFRACFGKGKTARRYCPHIYDVMGCYWNEPANYENGVFEQCEGESGSPPGIYGTSTWYQGIEPTPPAQPAGKSSNCRYHASVTNGPAIKKP